MVLRGEPGCPIVFHPSSSRPEFRRGTMPITDEVFVTGVIEKFRSNLT